MNCNAIAQLTFGLQILPLTHQIATISGLSWNRCLRQNRSERVEYYLLHGFSKLGFIVPDKMPKTRQTKRKSKYEGGLVLEPKANLYDDFIIVLDFKTDHVTESTVAAAAERYRLQVQTYAEALSRIYEMPVKAKYLYFFQLGRFVEV